LFVFEVAKLGKHLAYYSTNYTYAVEWISLELRNSGNQDFKELNLQKDSSINIRSIQMKILDYCHRTYFGESGVQPSINPSTTSGALSEPDP
jgi:hypothetical protein